jgi:hypothetical protein
VEAISDCNAPFAVRGGGHMNVRPTVFPEV